MVLNRVPTLQPDSSTVRASNNWLPQNRATAWHIFQQGQITVLDNLLFNRLSSSWIIHVLHFKVPKRVGTAIAEDFRHNNDIQSHVFYWQRADDILFCQRLLQSITTSNKRKTVIHGNKNNLLPLFKGVIPVVQSEIASPLVKPLKQ